MGCGHVEIASLVVNTSVIRSNRTFLYDNVINLGIVHELGSIGNFEGDLLLETAGAAESQDSIKVGIFLDWRTPPRFPIDVPIFGRKNLTSCNLEIWAISIPAYGMP